MSDHDHHHHQHGHCHHHGHRPGVLQTVLQSTGLTSLSRSLGSRSEFWLGAAIGAVAIAVATSAEARSALASAFRGSTSAPTPNAHNGPGTQDAAGRREGSEPARGQ
jgi:hypothetical protein